MKNPRHRWGVKASEILRRINSQETCKLKDIAAEVGCTVTYVSQVRSRAIEEGKYKPFNPDCLSGENIKFVRKFASDSGITFENAINALITDARIDQEELEGWRQEHAHRALF